MNDNDTTEPQDTPPEGTLTDQFNLNKFIKGLVRDLDDLRAGKISVRDAQARAVLAKQVLRGVHYVVQAQRFLEQNAKEVPQIENGGDHDQST